MQRSPRAFETRYILACGVATSITAAWAALLVLHVGGESTSRMISNVGLVIAAFAGLTCLPYADGISRAQPIGPFNSFSNEDHWTEDPTAPGVVLVGDAAGHNDPIIGQGLSIALRDVRFVSEIILAGQWNQEAAPSIA